MAEPTVTGPPPFPISRPPAALTETEIREIVRREIELYFARRSAPMSALLRLEPEDAKDA